jgi:hypothetical protein
VSQKSHLIFAFVAGMVGSGIMHYVAPTLAFAQDQTPVAKEVRAQSFTLVDPSNNVIGTFTSEPLPLPGVYFRFRGAPAPGSPVNVPSHIVLRDPNGRVIWTPDTNTKMLPLTMR